MIIVGGDQPIQVGLGRADVGKEHAGERTERSLAVEQRVIEIEEQQRHGAHIT